jgi:hypothetical protein
MAADTPFFIIGSGRSGTTLLRLLLSNHSRIHIPPETWFILPLVERLPLNKSLLADEVQSALDIITSHYRWPDLAICEEDLRRRATLLGAPRLREIIDLVYNLLLERSGKARLGDKTPPYIAIVPELAALYPGAKFIHLVRDGRDVSISYIELTYECRFYDGKRFEWIASLDKALAYRGSAYSAQILEVKYEDLVSTPEISLARICNFLGEAFEPAMMTRGIHVEAIPERERVIHRKINHPMSANSVAVWRQKLSGLECFLMESCLRKHLVEFGYDLRFRSSGWKPLLFGTGMLLQAAAPFLDRAVPFLRRRNCFPSAFYF